MIGADTLGPVWGYLAWSCNCMYTGVFPTAGYGGAPGPVVGVHQKPGAYMYNGRRFKLCELRGDWKHHASTWRLAHHYTCNNICHICKASRCDPEVPFTDFRKQPAWKNTVRSHQQFLAQEMGEPWNMLAYVAGFHYRMLKFDVMHTVHLGIGACCNGGCFFELLKLQWFPGSDKHAIFRAAYKDFKAFCRKVKVVCSQPVFKPWMLLSSTDEYCIFAAKAAFSLNATSTNFDFTPTY